MVSLTHNINSGDDNEDRKRLKEKLKVPPPFHMSDIVCHNCAGTTEEGSGPHLY